MTDAKLTLPFIFIISIVLASFNCHTLDKKSGFISWSENRKLAFTDFKLSRVKDSKIAAMSYVGYSGAMVPLFR
jgi:hypothetical protein